ncbi:MAG: sugar transferase, partial [Melioribacter sp.]|nr:sugar transferase [Melioribacter sp.]
DLDLCYRTQKSGYKVYYVHTTEIIHFKGESTKRSSIDETKIFYDAMHLFVRKHFSSSFFIESILQVAIIFRKLIAFANVYRLAILSIVIDFILFIVAVWGAEQLYSKENWHGFPEFSKPWVYILPALLQIIISLFNGNYKRKSLSTLRTLVSLFYGFIVLSSLTFFFKQVAFSRAVVLITYLISLLAFPLWRIFIKVFFRIGLESDTKKSRTLIVGNENKSLELTSKLKSDFRNLYQVIGFIGLTRKSIGNQVGTYKVLGTLDNIKKIILDEKIDKVIFSSDGISFDQMFSAVAISQGENVEFMVAGKELDYLVGKSSITMLDDIPLLIVQYNISSLFHRITKQIFDFFFSLILILLLVYPLIYLITKFTSKKRDFFQFILGIPNVIKGEKSFVGPMSNSYYGELFVGKTGLTGLWYVENVDRNDSAEIKNLDLFYAKNQNIWFDFEILGRSFSKMFFGTE